MDEYKFVNTTKLVAALTYTANKIRAKLGISSKLDFDLEGETGFGDPVDDIQVGITPSGSIELTANGTYDVTEKASAVVAVPQPTGSMEITANGTYDVTEKASAVVNVPSGGGITPSGTKKITITANGTTTEDVAAYANAEITVDVQGGGGGGVERTSGTLTFVERTPFNGFSLDVGIDCAYFALYATERPLQSNGRTYCGMFHDFTATTELNTINCTSNSGGSAYSGSLNAGGNISKTGTVLNFTTTDNSNFQAGITYQWYAWG